LTPSRYELEKELSTYFVPIQQEWSENWSSRLNPEYCRFLSSFLSWELNHWTDFFFKWVQVYPEKKLQKYLKRDVKNIKIK